MVHRPQVDESGAGVGASGLAGAASVLRDTWTEPQISPKKVLVVETLARLPRSLTFCYKLSNLSIRLKVRPNRAAGGIYRRKRCFCSDL